MILLPCVDSFHDFFFVIHWEEKFIKEDLEVSNSKKGKTFLLHV